jgi:squalene-hopene/tetraprenyl-beta-curcumene cyclase
MTTLDARPAAVERTLEAARARLLAARVPAGHWEGELSSSALSTATAVAALELVRRAGRDDLDPFVAAGLRWLAAHPNADGGYGDTVDSPSNPSTTALCWAALGMRPEGAAAFAPAEACLRRMVGDLSPAALAQAIARRYGEDRTFSAPILTMAALAGRLGGDPWRHVPALPFELAALPRSWFSGLNLRVVSYALPALISIGLVRHVHRPSRNPLARLARAAARSRTLRVLEAIQPASGGFLEATPLTSFVAMSLAGSGLGDHPVARRAAAFLTESMRPDGSWPIDTNLATWVTTLSVQALAAGGRLDLPAEERRRIREWLLGQQLREEHPYTGAAPGGWAWTDLPGGVPDADDTSGALLALRLLREPGDAAAAARGAIWLLDLQNADGGIPTFCRGWGKLPFDRSCPDLTAHALRAWAAWSDDFDPSLRERIRAATLRAFDYLVRVQEPDGSWIPLWFGSQGRADQANPIYGTSRVLLCRAVLPDHPAWARGAAWLASAQNPDGAFGASIEETALAVEALAGGRAAERGARWLAERTQGGERWEPSPLGLYFAKLWYSERLYPLIFTAAALGRAPR